MILFRYILKRVGESMEPVSCCAVEEDGTSGLVIEVFDDIRFVLMYFFMVAHKAACQTLSKAFLKSMKTW